MAVLSANPDLETLRVQFKDGICKIQLYRPEQKNAINDRMIMELGDVLEACEGQASIVVLEGLPEVFCFGADFQDIEQRSEVPGLPAEQDPEPLYDLWTRLAFGSFVTIAHVRGKANAGGIGFVAACDIVLCDPSAEFSLSEMLFGLMPACVLPFLIRRIGASRANFMTLITQPVSAEQAVAWGLVDVCEPNSENQLRIRLMRLRRLSKAAIVRYKKYMKQLDRDVLDAKPDALKANLEVFSDHDNLAKISRYVRTGRFPWEGD